MAVSYEIIEPTAKLYRVTDRTGDGLWYDANGEYTRKIDTLSHGIAKRLPMQPDPIFGADRRRWLSATNEVYALANWFSAVDMWELVDRGYSLIEYEVKRYRRLIFPEYTHEVFCMEDVIDSTLINPKTPYLG